MVHITIGVCNLGRLYCTLELISLRTALGIGSYSRGGECHTTSQECCHGGEHNIVEDVQRKETMTGEGDVQRKKTFRDENDRLKKKVLLVGRSGENDKGKAELAASSIGMNDPGA